MHPHLYELDAVNVDIQHNHYGAMRARLVLLAQEEQPGRLSTITMSLRTTVSTLRARFYAEPAALPEVGIGQEPTSAQEPVVTPAASAATA